MKYTEYKEDKQHGSLDFPVQYYLVSPEHPQYVMPLHWHRELEVIRVLEGRLTLYLNNEVHSLKAGDIAFVSSGMLHRGEPENCRYDCVVFDVSMLSVHKSPLISSYVRSLVSSECELEVFCPEAEDVAENLLDSMAEEREFYQLETFALVAKLLYILYSSGAVKPFGGEGKKSAERRATMTLLIDKIEKDYTSKITLSSLAEIAQINEKYLCRFFKEFTGQTPIDYINRLRIDRACYEMTVNKMNVTEAVYECGFNEVSYFLKIFKKYKGITPGEYRKKYCVDN